MLTVVELWRSALLSMDPVTSAIAAVIATSVLIKWILSSKPTPVPTREGVTAREPRTLPTYKPIIGDTFDMLRNLDVMHDWMVGLGRHFGGEAYFFSLLGRPKLAVLYTPQQFEDVVKNEFDAFPKGPFMRENLREIFGEGIFAADGLQWYHQRKVAAHMFTMRAMRDSMAAVIAKHLVPLHRVLAKAAASNEPIDLATVFNRFTMEAFAEIGFGEKMNLLESDVEHPFHHALDRAQELVIFRFVRPSWVWKLQRWLNVGAEAELKQVVNVLDTTMLEVVRKAFERRERRAHSSNLRPEDTREYSDVVSLFVENLDSLDDELRRHIESNPMFFRDVAINFLLAGRDTTAQTLSWLFVELDKAPHVTAKLRAEIASVVPTLGSGAISTPTMHDVQQLVYMEAVIKETLRLHPPIPVNPKHVDKDVVLSDGTFLRKGMTVSLAVWAMGRMPFVWGPDADEFKPERWIDAQTGKLLAVSPYKFASFNAGPRLCLGMNLAMMEVKMVVAAVLSQFSVTSLPGQNITYVNSVSLPIKGKMMVNVRSAPLGPASA